MPSLVWDQVGERQYETGVDHGVLYIPDESGVYATGVAWNGLTTVTESPTGAEPTALYADNIKYLNLYSYEEFGATVEAYTYPPEFDVFDGLASPSDGVSIGQQPRPMFGLSYRSRLGNDVEGSEFGYKLHLIYGATASPSEKAYATINDSPEAITFSWAVSTIPQPVTGFKPTSLIVINSKLVDPANLTALEMELYGDSGSGVANLPSPDEIIAIFDTVHATGATAGTPGTWTPGGSVAPASVAALQAASPAIIASPLTAWTTGEFVQTGTAGAPGQAHWDGDSWEAGTAP